MSFRMARTILEAKLDRREIMKVMAASAAFAGLTGCTKLPEQKLFLTSASRRKLFPASRCSTRPR